jgi:cystathionine beta-lyase/cystathionine gamma-synthase
VKPLAAALLCVAALVQPLPALSADAVTDAMQAAYAPYRAALFRTNGKSQEEAAKALDQAQQAWQALRRQVGATPPPPYDRDARFEDTLAQVGAAYERAAAEVRANRLSAAHETLEAVRELLAELRQRNNVVVFSDAMNAYHAKMELLLDDGAKAIATDTAWMEWMARVGVLDHLAGALQSDAPAPLRADADFEAHLKAVQASVAALRSAALARDATAVRETLGKLKVPYSRMFLKYG